MRDWQRYVRDHLPSLRIPGARENEIIRELAAQIEQTYVESTSAGCTPAEAEARAEAQFPDWEALAREINAAEIPEYRSAAWTGMSQDLRYAARLLVKSPGFTLLAVVTLALGIGANTVIFTAVDKLALRPLPYRNSRQLMVIETRESGHPEAEPWTAALDFFDLRDRAQSFSAAGISPVWNVVGTGGGESEHLDVLYVSANFFGVLGVRPAIGRDFRPEEDKRTSGQPVVILSHAYWQRHFGSNPNSIRQTLNLDGSAFTIIGVLPADFHYLAPPLAGTATDVDLWLPLADNEIIGTPRSVRYLKVIARRKAGFSEQQSSDEVRRLGSALIAQYPATDHQYEFTSQPLEESVTGRIRPMLLLLLGAVGFVLLMACANVANLRLAKAAVRGREISVRVALGASTVRLIRQLLIEGLLLAALGGVAGVLFAFAGLRILIRLAPAGLIHGRDIALNGAALAFTCSIVLLSAILSGIPSAWRLLRPEIVSGLRESGRSLTAAHRGLQSTLVVVEIALALTLMVGAGLLIRSFVRLLDVDPGFRARDLITLTTQMPPSLNAQPVGRLAMYQLLRDRMMQVPGVQSVGAVSRLPLTGTNLGSWVWIEGRPQNAESHDDAEFRSASPEYLATMGVSLLRGRFFDDHDNQATSPVIVINQAAARRFWPGQDPIGRHIKLGPKPEGAPWITVVGVVGDMRHFGLELAPQPEVYRPAAYSPLFNPIFAIRFSGDSETILSSLTRAVHSVDPALPVYNAFSMETLVDRSAEQRRFVMMLLAVFAAVALLLAAVGIYGTVSEVVAQRTHEIGLRMALGATPRAALEMVLGHGLRLAIAGIAFGVMAAAGLSRMMAGLLFETRPLDPVAYAAAALGLGFLAIASCVIPARRATRLDPLIALREE